MKQKEMKIKYNESSKNIKYKSKYTKFKNNKYTEQKDLICNKNNKNKINTINRINNPFLTNIKLIQYRGNSCRYDSLIIKK